MPQNQCNTLLSKNRPRDMSYTTPVTLHSFFPGAYLDNVGGL